MNYSAVIFDMDGLLIDSEPLWNEAAFEVFSQYGINLSPEQYSITTGLRTAEFVSWWFDHFKIDQRSCGQAEADIILRVIDKVQSRGKAMPGLEHIFNFFISRNMRIGLASSSPQSLIDVVIDYLGIRDHLDSISSAEQLKYGKPHPQVYLDCADSMYVTPVSCICFEDSFNGLLAAKAARMKTVIVPAHHQKNDPRWVIADLKIASLTNFNELLMQTM